MKDLLDKALNSLADCAERSELKPKHQSILNTVDNLLDNLSKGDTRKVPLRKAISLMDRLPAVMPVAYTKKYIRKILTQL